MARMCISATAVANMEKAADITKAAAAMRAKDMEKVAAMIARVTRRVAADMVKDITKAAAATEKRTNSRGCGFYSRWYLRRF